MDNPLLLSIHPGATRALGVGRSKVYELISAGELRTVTIGRRRLVPAAAIAEYVSRLESNPAA